MEKDFETIRTHVPSEINRINQMTTFQNLFTGLSEGSFDTLKIRDSSGSLVDILTLIGGGSGGGAWALGRLGFEGACALSNIYL